MKIHREERFRSNSRALRWPIPLIGFALITCASCSSSSSGDGRTGTSGGSAPVLTNFAFSPMVGDAGSELFVSGQIEFRDSDGNLGGGTFRYTYEETTYSFPISVFEARTVGSITFEAAVQLSAFVGTRDVTAWLTDRSGLRSNQVTVTITQLALPSAAGIWVGDAVTPGAPDLITGFEFSDSDSFTIGDEFFTATFQGGQTESQGIPIHEGFFAWHIDESGASIEFSIPGVLLRLFARMVAPGDSATIEVLDEFGAQILSTAVPDNFQQIQVSRDPGESRIGSVIINVDSGSEIVIDSFSIEPPDTSSRDEIVCLFAPDPVSEFVCAFTDINTGEPSGGASGSYIANELNEGEVSGSGSFYPVRGEMLVDGSTVAPLRLGLNFFEEGISLFSTFVVMGLEILIDTMYDATYDRGSSLATVTATYSSLELFGETSSLNIDSDGVMSGQTETGCILNGEVSVIDEAANVYGVNLVADIATCNSLAGNYFGLGTTQDEAGTNDLFVFAVFSDEQMILAQAVK